MCFRPAGIEKPPFLCSQCGEEIEETFGVFPTVCPFCSHEFTDEEMAIANGAAPAASAPGAPAAPSAPGVPAAPVAPAAPKAPNAPAK